MVYKERWFETWNNGIVYFIMTMALPIIPILIYFLTNPIDNYLYVLMITTCATMFYEFIYHPNETYGIFCTVETIICCLTLAIMLVWAIFSFFLTYPSDNPINFIAGGWENYLLLSLFSVPAMTVIIEICRSIYYEIKVRSQPPENNAENITKGARKV